MELGLLLTLPLPIALSLGQEPEWTSGEKRLGKKGGMQKQIEEFVKKKLVQGWDGGRGQARWVIQWKQFSDRQVGGQ